MPTSYFNLIRTFTILSVITLWLLVVINKLILFKLSGDNIHLKVLIPAIAGGAIIGKGGETITQIQKEMGATVKMSKAQDFYPGTNCKAATYANQYLFTY